MVVLEDEESERATMYNNDASYRPIALINRVSEIDL